MEDFNITASSDNLPSNTPARFTVYLSDFLQLPTDVEVGLTYMQCPKPLEPIPQCLCVHTDLVRTQILNNTREAILAVVPIKSVHSGNAFMPVPSYQDLSRTDFDRLDFELLDLKGNPISFPKGVTVIQLHFRKKSAFR
jgi:hypothetical protein